MASATTVDVLRTFLGDVQKIRYSECTHLGGADVHSHVLIAVRVLFSGIEYNHYI